ncbi:MAG: DUF1573 domain-containing protein [Planctomycetia bacterium]|nr:DUF1573 domain-containing protein [Planctomycetia bacterium]
MQALLLSCFLLAGTYNSTSVNYAAEMFETTSHDFGVVVKGSKTEFDFVFTNKYKEDFEIQSVSSSCQCTTPSFSPRGPIKSWEKGVIHVAVNTKNFVGNKNATITVRFSKPYYMEVQLHSYVYIRTDVDVEPGVVYFGTVSAGQKPVISVNVNSVKDMNWRILDVQSTCGFLAVDLKQIARQYNRVSYQMLVHLKDNAPPGNFTEYLELVTNDPNPRSSRFLVPVEGRIRPTLSVNPSPLSFGLLEVGKVTEKSLVLQGAVPFKILDITSEDPNISASIKTLPQKVHVVKLSYQGDRPRNINGSITIMTDLEGRTNTQVAYNGKIVPAPETEKSEVDVPVVEVPEEENAEVAEKEEPKERTPRNILPEPDVKTSDEEIPSLESLPDALPEVESANEENADNKENADDKKEAIPPETELPPDDLEPLQLLDDEEGSGELQEMPAIPEGTETEEVDSVETDLSEEADKADLEEKAEEEVPDLLEELPETVPAETEETPASKVEESDGELPDIPVVEVEADKEPEELEEPEKQTRPAGRNLLKKSSR